MGYKDKQYWTSTQDALMATVITGDSTTIIWLQSYRKVLPRLKKMGESILRRYFSYLTDDTAQDLIMDAIAMLITKGNYNPEKPKLYSYCGTIFKRYFYDKLVVEKQFAKNGSRIDNNYDITDDEWVIDNVSYEPDFEYLQSERQEMLEIILEIIDEAINEVNSIVIRNVKRNAKNKKVRKLNYAGKYENEQVYASIAKERELCFLHAAREYFLENFIIGTVSSLAMADYIDCRCEIPSENLSMLQRKYFNIGSQPAKIDAKTNAVDFSKRRKISYLMDDEPPNELYVNRSRKDRAKKTFKDNENYQYF